MTKNSISANHANPANAGNELAPLAGLAPEPSAPTRDVTGRFLTGNNGGGRPKGTRNRLTDALLSAITDDFQEHGLRAISKLRESDPGSYLKLISSLVPRDMILQRERVPDFSHLTSEEASELLQRARHNHLYIKAYDEFNR